MGGAQVYWRNEHPRFPDGGKLSQFMEALPIGGEMDFKGPLGHFVYLGRGRCWPAATVPELLVCSLFSVPAEELIPGVLCGCGRAWA